MESATNHSDKWLPNNKTKTMNKLSTYSVFLLLFYLISCGQNSQSTYKNYSDFEVETDQCLDRWLESKDVDINELKDIFENYFTDANISDSKDPLSKQYKDILKFWEYPTKQFPIFSEKKRVIAIQEELKLTNEDILYKNQLSCFATIYLENEKTVDTTSSFYIFGSIVDDVNIIGDISPSLIAGTINMFMDEHDLEKELYQKAIVLMFCFDMALYFSDGRD